MQKKLTMRFANIVCAMLGIAFASYAIYLTTKFKQFVNVPVGPEVFPRIMAAGLIICSVALLIQSLIKKTKEGAPTLSLRDRGIQRMLIAALMVVAFYLLWETAGFLILAPLLLFLLMLISDYRNYAVMAAVSLLVAVVVWLLFWKVLIIELPLGPLEALFY